MTYKEIELVILKLTTKKSLHPRGFTGELYKTYTEEFVSALHKVFQKIEEGECLQTHARRPLLS